MLSLEKLHGNCLLSEIDDNTTIDWCRVTLSKYVSTVPVNRYTPPEKLVENAGKHVVIKISNSLEL